MSDKAPDQLGHFDGWKGLQADEEGGLWSPSMSFFWQPGVWSVAKCNKHAQPPAKGCMCGIYALKTYEGLKKHGYHWGGPVFLNMHGEDEGRIWVLAELALKGRVQPGAIGWKAEMACVTRIYVPATAIPLGARIRKRYGCGLGIIDRFTGKREVISHARRA